MNPSFDNVAGIYSEARRPLPDFVHRFLCEKISNQKRQRPGTVIRYADLATGTGSLVRNIRRQNNVEMHGIDISARMLGKARQLPSNNPIRFSVGDVHRLPFASGSIDVASCCQALHLFDHQLFYDEINRILSTHGILVIVTYDLIAAANSPARYTNELFRTILAHEMWPGFSETGIHPDLLVELESNGFIPFETMSAESVFSYEAKDWQRRIESSSLSLKIFPETVRQVLLAEHEARLDEFFQGRPATQRQRCWAVAACRDDHAGQAMQRVARETRIPQETPP